MSNITVWIKHNPFHVACIAIMVVAAAAFYFPIHTSGKAFRSELESRDSVPSRLNSFAKTPLTIPPSSADEEVKTIRTVATAANRDRLNEIYTSFRGEFKNITSYTIQRNKDQSAEGIAAHTPMSADLFPKPSDESIQLSARGIYKQAFQNLRDQLKPGLRPDAAIIKSRFDTIENSYRSRLLNQNKLTPEQEAELNKRFSNALKEIYINNAKLAHIYIDPISFGSTDIDWLPGPFDVKKWAQGNIKPSMLDIWNSQIDLWIQQDLVQVISMVNQVNDEKKNITNSPIKRLLKIEVAPNYVGIPDKGLGLTADELSSGKTLGGSTDENSSSDEIKSDRVKDNFAASPTGRNSNKVYDVKHVKLSVIIESREISALLNAISKVNFMTVIGMSTNEIDEYNHFEQGYYYGYKTDAVQLDLTIETIWLRAWTAGHDSPEEAEKAAETFVTGLMPDIARNYFGLKPRSNEDLEKQLKELTAK